MYDYRVLSVLKVVDGDTVDLSVDLGMRLSKQDRYRLVVVDTPERGEPGFVEATVFARSWLAAFAEDLRVTTYKADSFGRYLADIYTSSGSTLSEALLQQGYGRYVA